MKKLVQKDEKAKTLNQLLEQGMSTQIALIRHNYELTLLLINQLFEDEVSSLAGERYSRDKPHEGKYRRWGSNPGECSNRRRVSTCKRSESICYRGL